MNADELADLIADLRSADTDHSQVEAKRSRTDLPKSVPETLSAFANASGGGVLILGLDETSGFAATGVADPGKIQSALADAAALMTPPLRPPIGIFDFEGEKLVVAEIAELEPAEKPCFITSRGLNRGTFMRVGDGDHRLSAFEVQMLLSSRGQPREDERPISAASIEDLDAEELDAFVARLRSTRAPFASVSRDSALAMTKVLVRDPETGEVVPSLAGLLAFGGYPQREAPQLNITFVHYPTSSGGAGEGGARFLDNVAVDGPIPSMVSQTMAVLRRNMARRAIVSGAARHDVWEYPEAALREAVVNAVVHRDLSPGSAGTQVQIEMYPDRLVITNPGGLYGPVTEDRLGEDGVSSARNATLMKVLEDVRIPGEDGTVCENRGSGIRTMLSALRDAGMSPPDFNDSVASFRVTFPNHALLSEDVVEWLATLGEEGLTDSQCIGLALMKRGGRLTNALYRNAVGVDSRIATAQLQDLVARGLVVQHGVRRWTSYTLAPPPVVPTPPRPRSADRSREILDALGEDTLTRGEIAQRVGLSDSATNYWLARLTADGTLERVGQLRSPKTKYRRPEVVMGQMGLDEIEPPG